MTMRQLRGILALSVFALAAACTKPAGDTDQGASTATSAKATTIATVNGKKISSDLLDVLSQATTGKPIGEATPEQKQHMVEQLISIALASQEAEKGRETQGSRDASPPRSAADAVARRRGEREIRCRTSRYRRRDEGRVRDTSREPAEGISRATHPR
jgi:hypothetical protein